MNWIELTSLEQLDDILVASERVTVFKHSTRCPISSMAKRGLEFEANLIPEGAKFYYLDLIKHRDVSNRIAEQWDVRHESPQILILQNNRCLYHTSHEGIEMAEICSYLV